MGRLFYFATCSLDGYIADEQGNINWTDPGEELHAFINDQLRPAAMQLYGRAMYEMMMVWETLDSGPDVPPVIRDYAKIWRGVEKVVYSTTLASVSTTRTRLERRFDPEEVRRMKAQASGDLAIGGSVLAAAAFRAGLVDECRLFVAPHLLGAGQRALPDGFRAPLQLTDQRRFEGDVVYLRYEVLRA